VCTIACSLRYSAEWNVCLHEGSASVELKDYVRIVRKQWLLISLVVGLALAGGAAVTLAATPQYAASVTFFVTTSGTGGVGGVADAYQGSLFSQQRVKSYVDLLGSERLAKSMVEAEELGLEPDEVAGRITAVALPDTVLLQATVTDSSPSRAHRIASAMSTEFIDLVRELETPPGGRSATVKVEVIEGPRVGSSPVSPAPVRNLGLALVLGVALGVGVALLRELLDTTIKTGDDLRKVAGVPTLATIAFDGKAKTAPLVVHDGAQAPRAEAFRQLRTNLKFLDVDRPLKAIVVTSAVPDEGKSTTTANLAITMAQAGHKVLLVEGDLRRPKVVEYLGLEGAIGLTNVLVGQVDIDTVLQPWGRDGLWVLSSGSIPPNPSELLGSQNMAELMQVLRQRFDVILVDAPPLLPVTDAAVAAGTADGVLLVVRHGHATRAQVETAVETLRGVDAHLAGAVLNMAPAKGGDGYAYAYDDRPGARQRLDEARHVPGAARQGRRAASIDQPTGEVSPLR
jgi:capsular exopolysaccharide synthesis family protein